MSPRRRSLQWTTSLWSPPLFLKSVDISGFKSFARSTRLELPRGITALVGPNGSGKSNVVDAIRWCLGEQSIRDLRSQRTEDVIYAGPRRSLGMAEVLLTFEDDSPGHDGPAEISIGRRLYRSGESEYLLNGRRLRLRDVQDALRGIGIDGARYIVVTQGMTDAWLTATAAERRALLEHAAGLSGYRTRRDECRSKLQTTAQNMATIEAVLAELEPRLRVLRRQARAVQDRDEARTRLASSLLAWYGWQWQEIQRRIAGLVESHDAVRSERDAAAAALRDLEDRADRALAAERERTSRLDRATAAVHATQREYDAARFALRDAESRQRSITSRAADVGARAERLQTALREAGSRRGEAEQPAGELEAERTATEAAIAAVAEEVAGLRQAAAAADRVNGELLARWRATDRERAQTERRRIEQEDAARRMRERLAEAELRLREIGSLVAGLDGQLAAARSRVSDREAARRDHRRMLDELEKGTREANRRRSRLQQLRDRVRGRVADLERRQLSAERALAAARRNITGGLLESVSVPHGWEQAVAAALGPWGVTGAPRTFGDPRGGGREALLAWRDDAVREAPELVWADELTDGLDEQVVHPLLTTLFVETLEEAENLWSALALIGGLRVAWPPLQIVTRQGEAVSALGRLPPGEHDAGARFLQLRAESDALQRAAERYSRRLPRLAAAYEEAMERLRAADDAERTAREVLEGSAGELAAARGDVHDLERRITRAREDEIRWKKASETSAREQQLLDDATEELAERLADLQTRLAAQERDHAEAERDAVQSRERLAARAAHSEELGRRREVVGARLQAQRGLIAALSDNIARLRAEESQVRAAAAGLDREAAAIEEELLAGRRRVEELSKILEEQEAHLRILRADGETAAPRVETAVLEDARTRVSALALRVERLAAQLEQAESDRTRLLAEIERELRLPIAGLPHDVNSPPSEDEIRRLRARATQYADVDLSVVDECAQLEERYVRLRDHLVDLRDASESLHSLLTGTDRDMQTRFAHAFDAVNSEFGRVFQVMLRGGSASLEQVDDDGGIGIRAQLPGRRARASSAFSGGEKTLVASSLLFGVLRIRPTPFCVLDEVDAALDESNVDRYLGALRDISERTQIIVVTHNRATMAAADVLYGLTMDDEGVSGLLSLRLDAYQPAV